MSVENPYRRFGIYLRKLRESQQETVADVSGAVEVDVDMIKELELGRQQPEEDIVLLLISHFALQEDEALKFWQLAGYDQNKLPNSSASNQENIEDRYQKHSAIMVMPMDARIVYTDAVNVMVNNFGVVINFLQANENGKKPIVISRVGMSKEHAKSMLRVLKETLEKHDQPNLLKQPESKDEQTKN